jgi:hypothetical protein
MPTEEECWDRFWHTAAEICVEIAQRQSHQSQAPTTDTMEADSGRTAETTSSIGGTMTGLHECPHCHYSFPDAESLRRHTEEAGGCPDAP